MYIVYGVVYIFRGSGGYHLNFNFISMIRALDILSSLCIAKRGFDW